MPNSTLEETLARLERDAESLSTRLADLSGQAAEIAAAAPDLHARETRLAGLSDLELVEHVYGLCHVLEDGPVLEGFYSALQEVFERFAPAAAWEELRRTHADVKDDESFAAEVEATQESMARRAAARVMLRSPSRA
jgi:hypothetical protein